ncbi:hypothetical protein CJ204_07740 [Corynebacterium xerosis]|uniref:Uncharacterized protein n=1 Tax=Corynebacterium xerosis TaxID=1725 RepID=A0A2N6SYD9_9CORY|nr:hypothetical protein CJ204_07740 [Corynebacterium xerosis]
MMRRWTPPPKRAVSRIFSGSMASYAFLSPRRYVATVSAGSGSTSKGFATPAGTSSAGHVITLSPVAGESTRRVSLNVAPLASTAACTARPVRDGAG